MDLNPKLPHRAQKTIERFISHRVEESGSSGVVVGLSGGLDSALVTRLAVMALGKKKVKTLFLPDERTRKNSDEVLALAASLGSQHQTIDINRIEKATNFVLTEKKVSRAVLGNIKARARMMILYSIANSEGRLVLGPSNKSELLMGYFTKFGDGGSDLMPIGDLYKTQVLLLAREMSLDPSVLKKKPSADLWDGQSDEIELGISYERLDRILLGLELGLSVGEIEKSTGEKKKEIQGVVAKVQRYVHKRELPHIPKLSSKTIGIDWRD